jgi:hypothetical protein
MQESSLMPTPFDRPLVYHDDPHGQESLRRRYGWSAVLYVSLGLLAIWLFLAMR